MNRRVLALLLAAASPSLALPADEALVRNGSFEAGAGGRVEGWTPQGQNGRAEIARAAGRGGGNALVLTSTGPGSGGSNGAFLVSQILDHQRLRGRRLRFSAQVKTEGAGLALVLYTPEGKADQLESNVALKEYVARSVTLDVPANASLLSVGLMVLGPSGGRVWVDDVVAEVEGDRAVRREEPPRGEPDRARPRPSGGGTPASVRIDVGHLERRVPARVFGMHIEWVENANGLLDAEKPVLRTDVLGRLRALAVPLFRFPGGIHADYYDWRLGADTGARRGKSQNPFTRHDEAHRFGTPEFLRLLEATGAEALITANYGTGSADQAAAWARQLRQAGARARAFEVGNEIYLSGPNAEGPNGKAIYHRPEQYAKDFPAYRSAIRAVAPEAEVGAIAHLDTGSFPLAPKESLDWSERMLKALKGRVDFLALHNAYAPVILDDAFDFGQPERRDDAYRATYAAVLQTKDNLDLMESTLARTSPENRGVPFAITEFGPLFGVSTKLKSHLAYVDQSRTLAAALYLASLLDLFVSDPRVSMACYTNPIHRYYGSLLTDTDQGLVVTPSYYVYSFYRTRFEPQLVATGVTSSTFDAPAVGIVKARRGVGDLLARASVDDRRRRLTAVFVNRSSSRELTVATEIRGFLPRRMDCQILTAARANAINGRGLTDTTVGDSRIEPRPFPCPAAATFELRLPPNAVLSLVAEK